MRELPTVGIAFNLFRPLSRIESERQSEEAVEQSAAELREVVQKLGYPVIMMPLDEDVHTFIHLAQSNHVSVIINLCESFAGRALLEANVAGLFEMMKWPFTGNPSATLSWCLNKYKTKAILKSQGLPVAPGCLARDIKTAGGFSFPLIVKPNAEDASLGIYADSIVYNQRELSRQVEKVKRQYGHAAIVEAFIPGREFNVAVLEHKESRALPVSEIDFSTMPEGMPHICSYEAKWFEDHVLYKGSVPKCPAPIDDDLRNSLQDLAVRAFRAMDCRDYARVDFRVSEAGEIFILEVNPNPDVSLNAGYARALKAAGISYAEFWRLIIDNALHRKAAY